MRMANYGTRYATFDCCRSQTTAPEGKGAFALAAASALVMVVPWLSTICPSTGSASVWPLRGSLGS